MIANAKRWATSIAAGLLLSLPFWHAEYGWLLIPCVVGYLLWLDRRPSVQQIWLSGLAFVSIVVNWLYHIHATELIPNNILAIIFLTLTFSVVVGTLSLGFWLLGWAINRFEVDINSRRALLVLPAWWALSEWARSLLFSVVSLGPGGTVGPHWNFGSLAFAAAVTPLGYAARVVGQYGLSAMVVALSLGVVAVFRGRWRQGAPVIAVVAVLCLVGWGISMAPNGSRLRVGVLQLDDSSYSDYGYQRDLAVLTAAHDPHHKLDIMVLPEYSYIFVNKEYKQFETKTLTDLVASNGLVITSRSGEAEQGHKNLVTAYKPDGQIAAEQEKQFLIPGGEYIPYFYEWILVLSGNTSVIGVHNANNAVQASPSGAQPIIYKSDKLGSLACSGAIAPDYYRRLTADGATILTNSAALSTMGLSSSYYDQARQMASFIAISTARPFVQSARGAQVFMLDSNAQVVADSQQSGIHYIEGDIQTNKPITPYGYLGDLPFLIVSGLIVLFFKFNHKGY